MASENDRHEAYKNYIAANESTVLIKRIGKLASVWKADSRGKHFI